MYHGDLVLINEVPQPRSLGQQFFQLKKSFQDLLASHAVFIESRMNQIGRDLRLAVIVALFGVPIFVSGFILLALVGIRTLVESEQAMLMSRSPLLAYTGGGLILISIALSVFALLRMRRVHETAQDMQQEFRTDVETYVMGRNEYEPK